MGEFSTAGTHIEYTFVWQRETNNLLICNILGCFVDPVWELRCQMVCPESLVMAVPVADNLTPMTAVTSVGNLVIMPMTVIVSTSGIVDAAGTLTSFFYGIATWRCCVISNLSFSLFIFRSGSRSRSRSHGRRYRSRSRSNERQVLLLLQLCLDRFTVYASI